MLDAPALLVTWFLGSESGPAIADILFGAQGPSARLPVSFPYATGQEPLYYAHKATGPAQSAGPSAGIQGALPRVPGRRPVSRSGMALTY